MSNAIAGASAVIGIILMIFGITMMFFSEPRHGSIDYALGFITIVVAVPFLMIAVGAWIYGYSRSGADDTSLHLDE